mmetsp:Transcript_36638/g.41914  ORF Transcript_36638/g.41914 Transcript_36638/m.41914 type:complete len:83 (+) Transcript_36638:197-445(+)
MSKHILNTLQPFNNSSANEDDEEESKDDGDDEDDDTYTLRTRRRRSSRGATATDGFNSDDAVASSDKGASVKCRRTSTAYNN